MKEFLSSAGELIVDVFWDNAITTVPITISIVAIIISIAAANGSPTAGSTPSTPAIWYWPLWATPLLSL